MVQPVVRPDRNEALKLVQHFNEQLRLEGWNLMEEEKIACGALPLRRKALMWKSGDLPMDLDGDKVEPKPRDLRLIRYENATSRGDNRAGIACTCGCSGWTRRR